MKIAISMLALLGLLCIVSNKAAESRTRPAAPIASWHDLPGTDGRTHSLEDLKQKTVVVVGITCNHCPIALEYFERLKEFDRQYAGSDGRVALVTASVSSMETDKLPRMKELAEKEAFRFPYLYDESQQIARNLGARVTPQFFVLDQQRRVAYSGPWDDNVNATKVKRRFVEEAVVALMAGKQPPVSQVRALGCAIKYEARSSGQ